MKIDDIVGLEKEEILRTLKFDNIQEIIEGIKPKPCIIYSKKFSQTFPTLVKKSGLILMSERGETISFENNKIHLLVSFNRYTKEISWIFRFNKEKRKPETYIL